MNKSLVRYLGAYLLLVPQGRVFIRYRALTSSLRNPVCKISKRNNIRNCNSNKYTVIVQLIGENSEN